MGPTGGAPGNGEERTCWAGDHSDLLRLLGTAWLLEPDTGMLGGLAAVPGLADAVEGMVPEAAALEYSQVILQLVPPYASLFLDESAMLNGVQAERMLLEYHRAGFTIAPDWRAGPADHLGIELHFLAFLLDKDRASAGRMIDAFLLPWAPVCLLAIQRIENARLYPNLAKVTLATLLDIDDRIRQDRSA